MFIERADFPAITATHIGSGPRIRSFDRFRKGNAERGRGMRGYWEEYQYQDSISSGGGNTYTGSSDVGTGWASGLLSSITALGTTYIQTQAAKDAAKAVAQSHPTAGQTTVVSPSGQVMTTQAAPFVSTSSALDFLKNPLVLAGLGLGAFLLLRRKK